MSGQSLREMGNKFRETILALGGGKSPNEVFEQGFISILKVLKNFVNSFILFGI